ncbi:MAG: hypothetical protein ABIH23_18835 [bacterium]
MTTVDTIYAKLPVSLQHAVVSAYGLYWNRLRFGSGYHHFLREYLEREGFTSDQWHAYQQERLTMLLSQAARKIPFYKTNWSPAEKKSAESGRLGDLPLLGKEPIRANPTNFLREDLHPRPRLTFHTSGSTGTPIASIWTVSELRNSLALREVRSARWAGVSFDLPRATFSGRIVEPDPNSKGPFYRFNLVERQAYLSPFHLRPDTARFYVQAIAKHKIQWLTGYAVSYYLLAKFVLEQNLEVPRLRAVITTSEKVTPEMREVMEQAYRCRVFEEYSNVENSLFASECEEGSLHVSPDVAVVEILRPDGTPCEQDEPGEVVATCLTRGYQVFVRYRVGDVAAWDSKPCPCGRGMPILKEVLGRVEDVIVGPDGRQMVRFHGVFTDQPNVREGQIVQEAVDRIKVNVVGSGTFNIDDERDIIRRVRQRLGADVHVVVELVQSIPRTKAGKFKAVVSNVDPEEHSTVSSS